MTIESISFRAPYVLEIDMALPVCIKEDICSNIPSNNEGMDDISNILIDRIISPWVLMVKKPQNRSANLICNEMMNTVEYDLNPFAIAETTHTVNRIAVYLKKLACFILALTRDVEPIIISISIRLTPIPPILISNTL
jgi:hypothetical protein